MNLHIVTVATQSEFYFPYLVETCKRYGKNLEVLGFGEKWQGYNWKFKLMIDYLTKLSDNDIVCFVDGYDVICVRDLNELVPAFLKIKKETNCSIIAGHDKTDYILSYPISFFYGTCNELNLNSGTYIGYVKDLLIILTKSYNINKSTESDDQVVMTKYCKQHPSSFHIDDTSKLFLTMIYPFQEIDTYLTINKMVEYNGEYPFFIHGAGSTSLTNILNKLGYKYDPSIKKNLIKYSFNKIFAHIYTIKYYILFIIIILFIIYQYIIHGL